MKYIIKAKRNFQLVHCYGESCDTHECNNHKGGGCGEKACNDYQGSCSIVTYNDFSK